jgi:cellulose synthase (UDP-forming)
VVTPKRGDSRRQPRAVAPALLMLAVLLAVAVIGLLRDRSPATLNNVAFAMLHVTVLTAGILPALRPAAPSAKVERAQPAREAA